MKGANTTMKRLARKTRRARAAIVPFAAALLAALSPAPAARAADAADFARCVDVTVAYAPGEALADFPALVRHVSCSATARNSPTEPSSS